MPKFQKPHPHPSTITKGVNSDTFQRCDSKNNGKAHPYTMLKRCDFSNIKNKDKASHTSDRDTYESTFKNRFSALATEQEVISLPQCDDLPECTQVLHSKLQTNPIFNINKNKYDPGAADYLDATVTSSDPDKYELDLRFRPRHRQKIHEANGCDIFKLWDSQTQDKFGFIPLQDQILPQIQKLNAHCTDLLAAHNIIVASGTYNFMNSQLQIPSQLNPNIWDKYLGNYWDKQLKCLIRYGFPLDFNNEVDLKHTLANHGSANKYPQDLEAYLAEEQQHKAILGPFDRVPIHNLHVSPFMTREKPGAPHRRVIIDLSFPAGHSVNTGVDSDSYLGSKFMLTLPTIDTITNKLAKLGKGALIYKIDISRAFRHVKMDPADYKYLGLHFKNYFIDSCLPFGFRHGSAIFQRLSDAIRFIMVNQGHHVTNYIDDIIGYATKSKVQTSFNTLYALLEELGFTISKAKLVEPTTKATCLGVELNTETFTVAVPHKKLVQIKSTCTQWLTKKSCQKRDLQSLLGKLLYITKCVRASRPFLNRMLDTLRMAHKHDTVYLDTDFKRDLNWFIKFLPSFNGVAFFQTPTHSNPCRT